MKTIKIWNDNPSDKQTRDIARCLREGEIAIMPTDSLYGICCDALSQKSIERVARLKGLNPDKSNLSIICSDISMAAEYARIDNYAFQMMKELTPGPVTFIFKATNSLPKAFKGRKTVGIRIPDNATCRRTVEELGHPVMTTSIMYDDEDEGTNPDLIAEVYDGKADLMVDGGMGSLKPSAIIDCTGSEPVVVREGKATSNQ